MLSLPPHGHAAKDLFDVRNLAKRQWTTFPAARIAAQKMFEDKSVRRVNTLAVRANGDLHLVSFGPRGGHKTLWNFGQAPASFRVDIHA